MAFMAVLESDLRALSTEARRRYPAVKDGAEHAILKLRSLSSPSEIAHHEDIVRIFLMACEVKTVKLSVIGLSCLQKLISHDAVAPSALKEILATLKDDMKMALGFYIMISVESGILEGLLTKICVVKVMPRPLPRLKHGEMADESVQLKTLQTILIMLQSRLQPDNEVINDILGVNLNVGSLDKEGESGEEELMGLDPVNCFPLAMIAPEVGGCWLYSWEISFNVVVSCPNNVDFMKLLEDIEYN
ncbi:unnamed protein product [Ilex paraguariensis]|uniref:Mon2/Sec7/BIG1-like dimerisation and cyclophilin-binding domain-containing protein n=1 Tax=Ilex paraguariensis TaxID=185542 RepID=A0ABC8V1Q2_9AQUA